MTILPRSILCRISKELTSKTFTSKLTIKIFLMILIHPLLMIMGIVSFVFGLGLHVVVWRIRKPKRHLLALLLVFGLIYGVSLFIFSYFPWFNAYLRSWNLALYSLFYFALSCAYIQFYPAAQAQSPSLQLMLAVGKAGSQGLCEEAIVRQFATQDLRESRLNDLLDARLVAESGGKLKLTQQGKLFVTPFIGIRQLIGYDEGQG